MDDARLSPGSYGAPIPIMVDGKGEKRTLRTPARYGDIFNLDGWAGGGMSLAHYQHKNTVLVRPCVDAKRDPAEIRRTLRVPCYLTEDKQLIETVTNRFGPGTVAGSRQNIIDRLGEFKDAGIAERFIGRVPSGDLALPSRFETEIVAALR